MSEHLVRVCPLHGLALLEGSEGLLCPNGPHRTGTWNVRDNRTGALLYAGCAANGPGDGEGEPIPYQELGLNLDHCSKCHRRIRVMATAGGRLRPIDPDPTGVSVWGARAGSGNLSIVGREVRVVRGGEAYSGLLYTSHFATCTGPGSWRRRPDGRGKRTRRRGRT